MPADRVRSTTALAVAAAAVAACGGGASSDPVGGAATIEVLACRQRVDQPANFAEVALRDGRNLGTSRLGDRAGVERSARGHADQDAVVLVRETTNGDAASREIYVASRTGAFAERRLTSRPGRDDGACWSPDGTRVLFASDRDGIGGLWTMAADGTDARPFTGVPAGTTDLEPDWHAATGLVVWSRRSGAGAHALWLGDANGGGALPLTTGGGATGGGNGDREPAFAPDGLRVAFVRRVAADSASLCLCDVATGTVTVLVADGDATSPRVAPAQDCILFGLAEPAAGRATHRLARHTLADGTTTLLWPDERWRLVGLDLLPTLPALPAAAAPTRLDVTAAQVQVATASSALGDRAALRDADGDEYLLTTATIDGREIAGINVRFDLPVAAAADALELRVRIRLRSSRADGDAILRTSFYNPVDERFDTAVERPASTSAIELAFASASLRHVTAQRQVRVTAIADLPAGPRAELRVDLVEVVLVARAN
ncbi:MAG: PD40 domain-containing protein [Phycisphaerales bacterium]|nr:PD40 domain-containing protein [Phycisphaerales bacterium]